MQKTINDALPLVVLPKEIVLLPHSYVKLSASLYFDPSLLELLIRSISDEESPDVLLVWRDVRGGKPKIMVKAYRRVCLAAKVVEIRAEEDDNWVVVLKGLYRARMDEIQVGEEDEEVLLGKAVPIGVAGNKQDANDNTVVEQIKNKIVQDVELLLNSVPESMRNAQVTERTLEFLKSSPAEKTADVVGSLLTKDPEQRRKLLDMVQVEERLKEVQRMLRARLNALRLFVAQRDLAHKGGSKMAAKQQDAAFVKLMQGLKENDAPKEVFEVVEKEIERLKKMQEQHPGYGSTWGYIELLASLPWNVVKEEDRAVHDLQEVKKELDAEHYGMNDVKTRIIEFVAVRLLKGQGSLKAPVLCLVGPPGTGKTSIARSIANALKKPFQRIPLGGVRDEAEIRGHRRTYVGAMPGKVLAAMKRSKVSDPVLLLDEVDKTGKDGRGDPAAALLELLDPEQSHVFLDHYVGIPFDMSRVTFVATANSLEGIPRPLLDRMEVIHVKSFTSKDKLMIAKKHLVPSTLARNGLNSSTIQFPDESLLFLIEAYTREAGVRGLAKCIDSICRHVAVDLVNNSSAVGPVSLPGRDFSDEDTGAYRKIDYENRMQNKRIQHLVAHPVLSVYEDEQHPQVRPKAQRKRGGTWFFGRFFSAHPHKVEELKIPSTVRSHDEKVRIVNNMNISVDKQLIEKILGPPKFDGHDTAHRVSSPGAAAGLVWTIYGGQVQYIECLMLNQVSSEGKPISGSRIGQLKLTGLMGDMLNESAHIALSWVRGHSHQIPGLCSEKAFQSDVHIHLPSGAVPKDGPSAGITLLVALVSLFANVSVRSDTALTGEISLRGHVLPIGGAHEKVIAAQKAGLTRVILPAKNYAEAKKCIEDEAISGIALIPVNHVEEVLSAAFDPPIVLAGSSRSMHASRL